MPPANQTGEVAINLSLKGFEAADEKLKKLQDRCSQLLGNVAPGSIPSGPVPSFDNRSSLDGISGGGNYTPDPHASLLAAFQALVSIMPPGPNGPASLNYSGGVPVITSGGVPIGAQAQAPGFGNPQNGYSVADPFGNNPASSPSNNSVIIAQSPLTIQTQSVTLMVMGGAHPGTPGASGSGGGFFGGPPGGGGGGGNDGPSGPGGGGPPDDPGNRRHYDGLTYAQRQQKEDHDRDVEVIQRQQRERIRRTQMAWDVGAAALGAGITGAERWWEAGAQVDTQIDSARARGEYISPIQEQSLREAAHIRQVGSAVGGGVSTLGGTAQGIGSFMLGTSLLAGKFSPWGLALTAGGMTLQAIGRGYEASKEMEAVTAQSEGERQQLAQYISSYTGIDPDKIAGKPEEKVGFWQRGWDNIRDPFYSDTVKQQDKPATGFDRKKPLQDYLTMSEMFAGFTGRHITEEQMDNSAISAPFGKFSPGEINAARSAMASAGYNPVSSDVRSAIAGLDVNRAASLTGKFDAASGNMQGVAALLPYLPPDLAQELLQQANANLTIQGSLQSIQAGGQVAGANLGLLQAQGANWWDINTAIGGTMVNQSSQIGPMQQLAAQLRASGTDAGKLAATQTDAQILSLKAQIASLQSQQSQTWFSQVNTGTQAASIVAGLAPVAAQYNGSTPGQLRAATLGTASPLLETASHYRQMAAYGAGLNDDQRMLLSSQADQMEQQARLEVPHSAAMAEYGRRELTIGTETGVARTQYERSLYSGAGAGELSRQMDRQISQSRRMVGMYGDEANDRALTDPERLQAWQRMEQARYDAEIGLPRQNSMMVYGLGMAQAGLSQANVGVMASNARLFGGVQDTLAASLAGTGPIDQQIGAMERLLASGTQSLEEQRRIQSEIVGLRQKEKEIETESSRNAASSAVQIAQSLQGIIQTNMSTAFHTGVGGMEAIGVAHQGQDAAMRTLSAAQFNLSQVKGLPFDNPARVAAESAYSQAQAGLSSQLYGASQLPFSASSNLKSAQLGLQLDIAQGTFSPYQDTQKIYGQQIQTTGAQLKELQQTRADFFGRYGSQMTQDQKDYFETAFLNRERPMIGSLIQLENQMSTGWMDRIPGSSTNSPTGEGVLSSSYNLRESSLRTQAFSSAFGFETPEARDHWRFRGGNFRNTIGLLNAPGGFEGTAYDMGARSVMLAPGSEVSLKAGTEITINLKMPDGSTQQATGTISSPNSPGAAYAPTMGRENKGGRRQ